MARALCTGVRNSRVWSDVDLAPAATHLEMLDFPTARPPVMDPKRTFLEKAAAIPALSGLIGALREA